MKEWGVKYHELRFGKCPADVFVDDRMLDIPEVYTLLTQLPFSVESKA